MDKIGRYSEALDAQIDIASYYSRLDIRETMRKAREEFGETNAPDTLWSTLSALSAGQTYYWSGPICQLVYSAAESIPHSWTLREEALDVLCGFAWLVTPFSVSPDRRVRAITWIPIREDNGRFWVLKPPYQSRPSLHYPDRLSVTFFQEMSGIPPFPVEGIHWTFDTSLEALRNELLGSVEGRSWANPQVALRQMSLFATMLAFLQQRILIPQKFLADRMARHRFERAKQKPPSDEIRYIALRRVERRTGEGDHRDVEWTCQWIVTGHWRNQWYPSKHYYRPKYIASYLKGPEDKPLRHPGRLFAVVR